MNPRDVVNADDEQFTLLLARYSEALTAGGDIDPADDQLIRYYLEKMFLFPCVKL